MKITKFTTFTEFVNKRLEKMRKTNPKQSLTGLLAKISSSQGDNQSLAFYQMTTEKKNRDHFVVIEDEKTGDVHVLTRRYTIPAESLK